MFGQDDPKVMIKFFTSELADLKKSHSHTLIINFIDHFEIFLRDLNIDEDLKNQYRTQLTDLFNQSRLMEFSRIDHGVTEYDYVDKIIDDMIELLNFLIRKPSRLTYKSLSGSYDNANHYSIFNEIKNKKIEHLDHKEIRLKILHALYQKYYAEEGNLVSTDEIITKAFQNENDLSKVYPEIDILEKKYLIYGELVSGDKYPRWIRITEHGLDTVEEYDSELRRIHGERRFKILSLLYKKYFDVDYNSDFELCTIISELEFDKLPFSEIYQEFEYLDSKQLITGSKSLGRYPLSRVKITESGITTVEQIVDKYLFEISEFDSGYDKRKINAIKNEQDRKTKTRKLIDHIVSEGPQWIEAVAKISRSVISGQIDF